jgi:plasmid maintenance system antidote protein VapI
LPRKFYFRSPLLSGGITRVTPDTALRLARVFNNTPAYWVNLQANYDIVVAAKEIDVSNIEPFMAA